MSNDETAAYEALIQFLYRTPIGLVQTSLDGTVEMINPMAAMLLMPLSRDGSLDNLFVVLQPVAPQLRELVAGGAADSAAGGTSGGGVVCESLRIEIAAGTGGNAATQILSISVLKLDSSRLMTVLSDVTLEVQREQRGLARRLSDAARSDPLTRMPNRAAARERLQQAIARAPGDDGVDFAVLFMNCDRFRQINDTHGRAAGDEVLGLMADRLRATLRSRDRIGRAGDDETLAARIGGDEFVIVLDDLHRPDDVHAVARRLLDVLGQPYGIGPHQVHCGVSMGIVLRAQASGDADAVLQDASTAMVEARWRGGGRYAIFEPAMQQRAARRGAIEAGLRRALVEGELFVVYQPVVGLRAQAGEDAQVRVGGDPRGDLRVDVSAGVEALVRWRHPTRGEVGPLEFIGVAEECGLIDALGEFVLVTACRQFVAWQQALGTAAPRLLAVNLSRAQLREPGLAAAVHRTLQATGMPPAQLQLEVTESLAAQDETVQARLHELKALGLTLALDDFGTGYSSLACLHQLPVDVVKIDRSFVCQADTSPHHRVLIEATVRVAASLDMQTVAEGIETAAQASVIRALGCDKGQGYLFSRPLTAGDYTRWIEAATAAATAAARRAA